MPVHTFIAKSAADAIAQIRATLGPEAVVLNVRRSPVEGLARLWQKPGLEVLAHVPDRQTPVIHPEMLTELREELREIRQKVECRQADFAEAALALEAGSCRREEAGPEAFVADESATLPRQPRDSVVGVGEGGWPRGITPLGPGRVSLPPLPRGWRVGALLENSGLLPLHAQSVVEELRGRHGDVPPNSLAQEFELARNVLLGRWNKPALPRGITQPEPSNVPLLSIPRGERETARADIHVFIGPPGVGKTTCLCKWLAQTVLVEGRPASVWRLDGQVANTAESLSVFCEILGVPMERFRPASPAHDHGVLFIDLPGVNPADTTGLSTLGVQLGQLPAPQVHLVLNGAYETPRLLAQVRAFSSLPIADLIVTHLDEELRWGKLWNFVLGTNYTLRFLSAGQNIPGEFAEATPDRILARQFARK